MKQNNAQASPTLSRLWLTDGAIIFGPNMEQIAAMYANEVQHSAEIVKRYNSFPALVDLVKQYRQEAIYQGANNGELADIDAALKLAGEEI